MFFLPLKSIVHTVERQDRRLSRRLFLQLAVQVCNVVFPWDDDDDDNGTRRCSLLVVLLAFPLHDDVLGSQPAGVS